jgi:hypothetical protein
MSVEVGAGVGFAAGSGVGASMGRRRMPVNHLTALYVVELYEFGV